MTYFSFKFQIKIIPNKDRKFHCSIDITVKALPTLGPHWLVGVGQRGEPRFPAGYLLHLLWLYYPRGASHKHPRSHTGSLLTQEHCTSSAAHSEIKHPQVFYKGIHIVYTVNTQHLILRQGMLKYYKELNTHHQTNSQVTYILKYISYQSVDKF